MGGLNYHAVHHAFPDIPFDRLPAAFVGVASSQKLKSMLAQGLDRNPSA
jgi:fatty acid desaturase